MSISSYQTLVRDISLYAPNCPDQTILYALKMTVIDFCQETLWWKYEADPMDVIKGETEYQVEVPSGTESVLVLAAWYEDRPLVQTGFSARSRWPRLKAEAHEAQPQGFSAYNNETIKLYPTPDETKPESLRMLVALMPKRSATGADASMMDVWTDTLISGALSRIYDIPNQPFSNPDAAKKRELAYRQDVVKARIQANKMLTNASLRVQPRQP